MAPHICKFCFQPIQHSRNLNRHMRNCRVAMQQNQGAEPNLNAKIAEQQCQILQLKELLLQHQQQQLHYQQQQQQQQQTQLTAVVVADALRMLLPQLGLAQQQQQQQQQLVQPSTSGQRLMVSKMGTPTTTTTTTGLGLPATVVQTQQPCTSGQRLRTPKRRRLATPPPPPPPPQLATTTTTTIAGNNAKRLCYRCTVCIQSFNSKIEYNAHLRTQTHLTRASTSFLGRAVTQVTNSAFKNHIISLSINHLGADNIDIRTFLEKSKYLAVHLMTEQMDIMNPLKINLEIYAHYLKQTDIDESIDLKSFITKFEIITRSTDLMEVYKSFSDKLIRDSECFAERDSGWTLISVSHLTINFNAYTPLKGASYTPLPKDIQSRRAVINVQNQDQACFLWSLLAGLFPVQDNSNLVSSYPHYSAIFNLHDISMPIQFKQIPQFEVQNNLSINVYTFEYCNKAKRNVIIGPLHLTKNRHIERHFNLLYFEDDENHKHFTYIKNMSRLISMQISKFKGATFLCEGCLLTFSNEVKYSQHVNFECNKVVTTLPSTRIIRNRCGDFVPDNQLQFTDFNAKMTVPFAFYCDTETFLSPITSAQPNPTSSYTQQTSKHIPYSFAYQLVCSFDKSLNKFVTYTGLDCCKVFIERITEDCKRLYNNYLKVVIPMHLLTPDQIADYAIATTCHICERKIRIQDVKVRDHCHLTGAYVGAAHSKCNLNYKVPTFFPIFFHNLSGYDAHLFIQELGADQEPIDIIPQNMEKYVSFSKTIQVDVHRNANSNVDRVVYVKMRFLDSFKFMSSSLDKLSSNLTEAQLVMVKSHFPDDGEFKLLCRKGIFPYSYITDYKTLDETKLPSKDNFFNNLTGKHITDDDYMHALNVWTTFNCQTLRDYAELYLKTDVLLLSDCAEAFRKVCHSIYKLDPCHYYTAPGLSWSAMLKFTKIRLELLTDIEQHNFIRRGIRGGVSNCSLRYAKANNKYLQTYDENEPSTFLAYWDANNLYGWAMSQPLPYGDFTWLSNEEIQDFNVNTISKLSGYGYILEVDIDYPETLHEKHNDLPFLAENILPPNSKFNNTKLITNLNAKTKYIIHYRTLQQCLSNGLVLTRIHRILKFKQSNFMKSYIELNTEQRQLAKNTFEKDFFKLMNNSVYGKTMENVDKRVDIKLVTAWEDRYKHRGAGSLIARPNFNRSVIFNENLVGIHLDRLKVHYNKPTYIGFTVLEVSKYLMYEFYYKYIKSRYGNKVTLCYMDTDSLILLIQTDDLYADMRLSSVDIFDTSNFPLNNPYGIPLRNKAVPGLLKDEAAGRVITEFAGLRSKMYAYHLENADSWCKRAKGVKRYVVENDIHGTDFVNCLFNSSVIYRKQNLFRTIKHTIFTIEQNKLALSPFDDKRYICQDNIHTLAWGSCKIPAPPPPAVQP